MENKKTSTFSNGLIWFGAGVSIAEIITGTYLAPLGFKTGIIAIIRGHIIGCVMLFLAGLIGGQTGKSSMETAAISFGKKGSSFFAVMNVLQLVGWTGIMIYDASLSAETIFAAGAKLWALIIGGLIIVWILVGMKTLEKINVVAMLSLFVLTIVLCVQIMKNAGAAVIGASDAMTFGGAVELAVAMPLSWYPVISDYTRYAEKPFAATLVSTITYGLVSSWMFIIGMGAAIFTETSDVAQIMVKAGLGIAGLIIVVFSTVTTTFLDAFSAGVSSVSVYGKINEKHAAVVATVIGTVGACLINMDDITNFLYLIGSVFAPMIAVLIADYFILGHDSSSREFDTGRFVIWIIGFVAYRLLMQVNTPVGNTLPDMVFTMIIAVIYGKVTMRNEEKKSCSN
ncbi:MAG: putative hydroxymethylpyrimidine transporter CytX [Baileyella intestinalis]|uniref:putative hydroxymethylpyrimidine transporter CytX n=1 Tax=Baileyella intestinalis TaxID=2606709 RepID=UPI002A74DA8F|nr:putative hydroxymethylpyrimidine transporter CytX [Baileyella intestinalis]MCI7685999.1 putative hydroxymethylpyrimidine transporter CytX [Clostridiales bacterium]MDY2995278.1 putative hydroxymethylpyrimidine transporter CytX [Baileyella intestinalis]